MYDYDDDHARPETDGHGSLDSLTPTVCEGQLRLDWDRSGPPGCTFCGHGDPHGLHHERLQWDREECDGDLDRDEEHARDLDHFWDLDDSYDLDDCWDLDDDWDLVDRDPEAAPTPLLWSLDDDDVDHYVEQLLHTTDEMTAPDGPSRAVRERNARAHSTETGSTSSSPDEPPLDRHSWLWRTAEGWLDELADQPRRIGELSALVVARHALELLACGPGALPDLAVAARSFPAGDATAVHEYLERALVTSLREGQGR